MFGNLISVFAAAFLLGPGVELDKSIQPAVAQNLRMARTCASDGRDLAALAHAAVVFPDQPLRIRIETSDIGRGNRLRYQTAVEGAVSMWEDVLHDRAFEIVDEGVADIVVRFQMTLPDRGAPICGHSAWKKGVLEPATVVFSAAVDIRSMRPDGCPMTLQQLEACAAHELGHVLGLEDSPRVGDVMGKMDFSRPVTAVRPEEIVTLMKARSEALRIRLWVGSKDKAAPRADKSPAVE